MGFWSIFLWSMVLVSITAVFWLCAIAVKCDFEEKFSKRKIAIIQMLCVFWPVGLAIGIPYGLFVVIKNSSLWFVRTTKIIFSPEEKEN